MSVLRIGCLEYSLASASLTSFLTICSWLLPGPWVSPSASAPPSKSSSTEDASEASGEGRRRAGGSDGETSACYCELSEEPEGIICFGSHTARRFLMRGMPVADLFSIEICSNPPSSRWTRPLSFQQCSIRASTLISEGEGGSKYIKQRSVRLLQST